MKKSQKVLLPVSILILLVIGISVGGCKSTPIAKDMDFSGTLFTRGGVQLRSVPSGARCYINEELVGRTPLSHHLPAGIHRVVLKKKGFVEHDFWVTVNESSTVKENIKPSTNRNSPGDIIKGRSDRQGVIISMAVSFRVSGSFEDLLSRFKSEFLAKLSPTDLETEVVISVQEATKEQEEKGIEWLKDNLIEVIENE